MLYNKVFIKDIDKGINISETKIETNQIYNVRDIMLLYLIYSFLIDTNC